MLPSQLKVLGDQALGETVEAFARPAAASSREVDALVADFQSGALSAGEARRGAEKKMLEVLQKSRPRRARRQLCHLLKLQEDMVQCNAANLLKAYFWISFLAYDVKQDQLQEIIDIEKEVSAAIGSHLRKGGSKELLGALLDLYQELLERLWLLPYLAIDRASQALMVEEHGPRISRRAAPWIELLEKQTLEDQELQKSLLAMRRALQRVSTQLPEHIVTNIMQLKPLLHHPFLPAFLGDIYLGVADWRRAVTCYRESLTRRLDLQGPGSRSEDPGSLWLEGMIYGHLGIAYDSLGQYREAITCHEKHLQIAQQLGDRGEEGRAYGNLGNAYQSLGQYREAITYHEKTLQIAQQLGDRGMKGSAYGNLGNAYQFLGQYREAITSHEKDLQIAQQLGDRGGEGRAYGSLGNAYVSLGQYREAITYLEKHLQIAQQLGDRGGEGCAYCNLGNAYLSLGQYREAITYHEKHLQITQQLGERDGEGHAYSGLGIAYRSLGQYREAITFHEKHLQIAQQLGNRGGEGGAYGNLGIAYQSLGQYREAITYHEKTLQIAQQLGDRGREGGAYCNLGNVYYSLGQYREAITYHEKTLQIAQQLGDRGGEGRTYGNLGTAYRSLGQYQEAITYHEKDLQIAQQLGDRGGEERAYGNLGNAYHSLGQYREAITYHEKTLQIAQQLGDRGGEGIAYGNLGNAYQFLGQYREAITCHEKDLQIAQQLGDRSGEGRAYGNLGNAYQFLGQYREAITYHEKALQIVQRLGDRGGEGIAYGNLGNAYQFLGQYREAITYHEKALQIAQQLGDRGGEGRAYDNLGTVHRALADFPQAEECYRRSIAVYSRLQQELTEQAEWKITIFEQQSKAYFGLEEVLLQQGKEQQALEASDFRRSRALVSLLLSKLSLPRGLLTAHDPLTAAEIQQLADRQNTTCLIYALLPFHEKGEIGVWVVPPQGEICWQPLPFTQAVGQDFEKLSKFSENFPFRDSERGVRSFPEISLLRNMYALTQLEQNNRTTSSDLAVEQFREDLKRYYEMLIFPIEEYLPDDPNQTLTIIPDGFLSQLPFAAFQDSSGNYLIEQHPLVILPSLQTLRSLADQPEPPSQGALVVGNPQTTARNLPEAEREAQVIAPLLGLAADQVLTREAASVQQVVERIQQARWIHFACHGEPAITPPDHPHSVFEGRLLLASDVEHEEGSLYAQRVAQLQLNAELVCMSACYSGTGKLQREGSVGLVWSFLAAGARATLATYWPLPDTALTVRMMQKFYQQVLGTSGQQVSKAHALQQAMQMAIEEARDRPDQWGAFFLSGLV